MAIIVRLALHATGDVLMAMDISLTALSTEPWIGPQKLSAQRTDRADARQFLYIAS